VTLALLALALLAAAPAPAAPAAAKAAPAAAPAPAAQPATAPAAQPVTPAPARRVVDRVAALVNGEVVSLRDLQDRAGAEWLRVDAMAAGLDRDQAVKRVLQRTWEAVLADRLFHAQAVALQMETTESQVDLAVEDIKKRNRFDDAQLDMALASQALDRATFRGQIRRELESMQVLGYRVRSRIKVTDEDLQHYFKTHPAAFGGEEELHVNHLFLPLAEGAPAAAVQAAEAEAQQLRKRLVAGEDFAAVAKLAAKGTGPQLGGDLGWLKRGSIQKTLEEAFTGLVDGEVSQPVRVGAGLHLFKVLERRRAGGKSFEQAKDEIRDLLLQEQSTAYREQYLAELKRDAAIELRLPELKD